MAIMMLQPTAIKTKKNILELTFQLRAAASDGSSQTTAHTIKADASIERLYKGFNTGFAGNRELDKSIYQENWSLPFGLTYDIDQLCL